MLHYRIRRVIPVATVQVIGRLSAPCLPLPHCFPLLEQFVGRGEELSAGVDELQQIGPALIDAVLPLGHGRCLGVAGFDQVVYLLVDRVHPLLAQHPRLPRKLPELIPQKLKGRHECVFKG